MAKIQINGRKIALKQNFSVLDVVLKKYKLNRKKGCYRTEWKNFTSK